MGITVLTGGIQEPLELQQERTPEVSTLAEPKISTTEVALQKLHRKTQKWAVLKKLKLVLKAYRDSRIDRLRSSLAVRREVQPVENKLAIGTLGSSRIVGPEQIKIVRRKSEPVIYSIDFEPQFRGHKIDRTQIQLPRLNSELITRAKKIALEMKAFTGKDLTKYRSLYWSALSRCGFAYIPEIAQDEDLYCLATFLSLQSPMRTNAPNTARPPRFFDEGDPSIRRKYALIARYVLTEEHECKTAADVENIKDWDSLFRNSGCAFMGEALKIPGFIRLAFPGFLLGDYPAIRPHKLPYQYRIYDFNGISVLTQRVRNFVFEQDIRDEEGRLDKSKFLKLDWNALLKSEFREVISKEYDSCLDFLECTMPDLIGIEDGQIRPWDFKFWVDWKNDKDQKHIILLTKYFAKKLGMFNEDGSPDPHKIKSYPNWYRTIDAEVPTAIQNSQIGTVYDMFKAAYPKLCGWGFNQLNPGDISYDGMWQGRAGIDLLKMRFSKSMYELFEALRYSQDPAFQNHQVLFDPDQNPPLQITKEDFYFLRRYMEQNSLQWKDIVHAFDLAPPLNTLLKGKLRMLFELSLGTFNHVTKEFGSSGIHLTDIKIRRANALEASAVAPFNQEFDLEYIYYPRGLRQDLVALASEYPLRSPLKLLKYCSKTKGKPLVQESNSGHKTLDEILNTKKRDGQWIVSDVKLGRLLRCIHNILLPRLQVQNNDPIKVTQKFIRNIFTVRNQAHHNLREALNRAIKGREVSSNPIGLIEVAMEMVLKHYQAWKSHGLITS